MFKKLSLLCAVCFILAAPFVFSASDANAGRKLMGNAVWVYCSPCDNIECICDPGEVPPEGGDQRPASGKEGTPTSGSDPLFMMLALTFGALLWRMR